MVEEYLVSVETNSQTNDYKGEDKHEDVDNNRKSTCNCQTFIDEAKVPEQPMMPDFEPEDEMDLESETDNCDNDKRELGQGTNDLKIHNVKNTGYMDESESTGNLII